MTNIDLADAYDGPESLSTLERIARTRTGLEDRATKLDALDSEFLEFKIDQSRDIDSAHLKLELQESALKHAVRARSIEQKASGIGAAAHPRVTMSARMSRSIQELTLSEKRLVSIAGTKLYGTKEASPLVVVTAAQYAQTFGTSMQQAYQELQAACGWNAAQKEFNRHSGILSKRITFIETAEERVSQCGPDRSSRKHEKRAVAINWVQVATYNLGCGDVELRFTNDLVPHLRDITERFGQYLLENTKGLRSLAAWRLVDLCAPHHLGRFLISTGELMTLLEVTERQGDYKVFNREVLKPAIAALNSRFSEKDADPLDRSRNLHLTVTKVRGSTAAVTKIEFKFNPNRLLRIARNQ